MADYNTRPLQGANLSPDFQNAANQIEDTNQKLDKTKQQIDQLSITTDKFRSALKMDKELESLYKLGQHVGASETELKKLEKRWSDARKETKDYARALQGLDAKTIRGLNLETEVLEYRNKGLLGRIREVNKEWSDLKQHRVGILLLDKAGSTLANTMKTVGNSVVSALGLVGGIGAAVTMLRDAYKFGKELGQETFKIGQNLGMIGLNANKAFDPQLYKTIKGSVEKLRDEYGYTRDESMKMFQAIGNVGIGSPINAQDFAKLRDLTALLQRISGLSPELSMAVAKDGMRRFGDTVDNTAGNLVSMNKDAQSTGTNFNDWVTSTMNITKEFEDFAVSGVEVSSALQAVYHSSFTAQRGFKMSMTQAEDLTRTLLKLTHGADMSDEAFAALTSRMSSVKGMPRLQAMQEVKRRLMSGDKEAAVEFTQALEGLVNEALPGEKDYIRLKRLFETLGLSTKESFLVDFADAMNRGDVDKATNTVIGNLMPMGAKLGDAIKEGAGTSLEGLKADPLVRDMILQFKVHGVDDIENFMQKIFNVAMEQSLSLESFIENNLLGGFEKLCTKADEWIGKALGITTNFKGWSDGLQNIGSLGAWLFPIVAGAAIAAKLLMDGVSFLGKKAALGTWNKVAGVFKGPVNNAVMDDVAKAMGNTAKGSTGSGIAPARGIGIYDSLPGSRAPGVFEPAGVTFPGAAKTGPMSKLKGLGGKLGKGLGLAGIGLGLWQASAEAEEAENFGGKSERDKSLAFNVGGMVAGTGAIAGGSAILGLGALPMTAFGLATSAIINSIGGSITEGLVQSNREQYGSEEDTTRRLGEVRGAVGTKQEDWKKAGIDEKLIQKAMTGDMRALQEINKQLRVKNQNLIGSTQGINKSLGQTSENIKKIEDSAKTNLEQSSRKTVEEFLKMDFPTTMQKLVDKFAALKTELEGLLNIQGSSIAGGALFGMGTGSSDGNLTELESSIHQLSARMLPGHARGRAHQGWDLQLANWKLPTGGKLTGAHMGSTGGQVDLDFGGGKTARIHHVSEATINELKQRIGQLVDTSYEFKQMSIEEANRLGKNIGTGVHTHMELRDQGKVLGMDEGMTQSKVTFDTFWKTLMSTTSQLATSGGKGTQVEINLQNQEQAQDVASHLQNRAPKPVKLSTI